MGFTAELRDDAAKRGVRFRSSGLVPGYALEKACATCVAGAPSASTEPLWTYPLHGIKQPDRVSYYAVRYLATLRAQESTGYRMLRIALDAAVARPSSTVIRTATRVGAVVRTSGVNQFFHALQL